jgi:osmotically inducible protein OsmC
MAVRVSDAEWRGDLKDGAGTLELGSGAFEGRYSFKSRFEDGPGTNPEELIAAAHAACFSMASSAALSQKGHAPTRIHTKATVHFGPVTGGFAISRIELDTVGQVPGIDAATFEQVVRPTNRPLARLAKYRRYRCRRHIPTGDSRNRPRRGGSVGEIRSIRSYVDSPLPNWSIA